MSFDGKLRPLPVHGDNAPDFEVNWPRPSQARAPRNLLRLTFSRFLRPIRANNPKDLIRSPPASLSSERMMVLTEMSWDGMYQTAATRPRTNTPWENIKFTPGSNTIVLSRVFLILLVMSHCPVGLNLVFVLFGCCSWPPSHARVKRPFPVIIIYTQSCCCLRHFIIRPS